MSKLKKVASREPKDADSINHNPDDNGMYRSNQHQSGQASVSNDRQVEQRQWNHLPHTILAQIYSHLDPIHQRRASITCKQWRDGYFSPNLWRDVQVCPTADSEPWKGTEFVLERCGKYIRNLQVVLFTHSLVKQWVLWLDIDFMNNTVKKLLSGTVSLLQTIHCNCKNLNSLQLNVPLGLASDANFNSLRVVMETGKGMWEQIAGILKKSPSLQHLELDHIVDILSNDSRLQYVAQTCGNSLKILRCSGLFTDFHSPETYMTSFKMINQLTDLRLNRQYVTDELLLTLSSTQHCPMKVIEILIMDDYEVEGIVPSPVLTNNGWRAMRSHSKELQVGVVCYYESTSGALPEVLELSAIPLKWLKIISFTAIEEEIFSFLQNNFDQALQRLDLLNIHDKINSLTPEESDINPVVMTMWRCINLTQLNITGFEVTSDDIVGIARMGVRLRGNSLQTFGIQESCIVYEKPVDTREELVAEVRKCLTQDWEPLDDRKAGFIKWDAMDQIPANNWGSGPVSA